MRTMKKGMQLLPHSPEISPDLYLSYLTDTQCHILIPRQLDLTDSSLYSHRRDRHIPCIDHIHLIISVFRKYQLSVHRLADTQIMNGIIIADAPAFAHMAAGINWAIGAETSREILHKAAAARFDSVLIARRYIDLFNKILAK